MLFKLEMPAEEKTNKENQVLEKKAHTKHFQVPEIINSMMLTPQFPR